MRRALRYPRFGSTLVVPRRDGETRIQSRCVPWECGQATGTFPRVRPIHAHRQNRCGRRLHSRARMCSCPVSRACTSPHRFRSWPRFPRQALGSCAIAISNSLPCERLNCWRLSMVVILNTSVALLLLGKPHVEVEVEVATER